MNAIKNIGSILAELMKTEPTAFSVPKEGDLIEGTVLSKGARELLVDLGKYGTGAVYRGEIQNAREIVRDAKIGDIVHGKVVMIEKETGYVLLSLAEAGRQKAWMEIMELAEKGEPITVKVIGCNKGGLTTELAGLPAFIPVSQLAQEHYPRILGDDRSQIAKALEEAEAQAKVAAAKAALTPGGILAVWSIRGRENSSSPSAKRWKFQRRNSRKTMRWIR